MDTAAEGSGTAAAVPTSGRPEAPASPAGCVFADADKDASCPSAGTGVLNAGAVAETSAPGAEVVVETSAPGAEAVMETEGFAGKAIAGTDASAGGGRAGEDATAPAAAAGRGKAWAGSPDADDSAGVSKPADCADKGEAAAKG